MSAIADILGDLETGRASSDYSQSNNNAYHCSDHRLSTSPSPSRIQDNRPPSSHSHSRSRSRSGTPTRNFEPSHERTKIGKSTSTIIRDNRNRPSSSSRSRSGTPTRNYGPSNERMRNASYDSSSVQDQHHHQHQHKYEDDRHRRKRLSSSPSPPPISYESSSSRDQHQHQYQHQHQHKYGDDRVEGKYEREVWSESHMGKPPTGKSKSSAIRYNDSPGRNPAIERRKKNSDYDSDKISAPPEHEVAVVLKSEQQLGPEQELVLIIQPPPTGKSKNSAIRYNDNGSQGKGRHPEIERRRTYSDQDSGAKSAPSEDSTNRKKKSQSSAEHETAVVAPTGEQRLELRRPRPVPQHDIIEKESAILTLSCLESRRTKRIAILALIYCVIASAICGWLVSQFVRIPGLRDEINDLKVQVDRLGIEVDDFTIENNRLGGEVDRLDIINNDLDKTVASISDQKEQIEETAKQLNETLLDFKEQNEELKGQNDQLLQTSDALRGDIANLTLNLDDVRETEAQLKEDVAELKTVEERLKEDKITLTAQADNLNSTVEKLSEEVSNFKKENKEFKDLNEELRQIVSFIGDEAENVERTYEALTSYLADAIIRKQVLTMTALKEGMKKELAAWECGFRTAFSGQDFLKDENAPIGYSSYDTVMSYTGKFLQNLCLLRGNLETFLVNEVILSGQSIWDISSKDLSAGINIYTTNALDHYFPDEGEEGLNSTSWDEIDYDCIELPIEQRYYYAVA